MAKKVNKKTVKASSKKAAPKATVKKTAKTKAVKKKIVSKTAKKSNTVKTAKPSVKKAVSKVVKKKTAKKVAKAKKTSVKKKTVAKKIRPRKVSRKRQTKLSKKELDHFRELLVEKLKEIVGDVTHIESEALKTSRQDATGDLSSMPIHMADIGSDNYEQEFALGLMDSERKIVNDIHAALQRIADGTYGICEGTGEEIPLPRLEGIPWTRYCIKYAEMLEKGLVVEGERLYDEEDDEEFGDDDFDYDADEFDDEDLYDDDDAEDVEDLYYGFDDDDI